MGLVSVHTKAPHGCLITPGASSVLAIPSLLAPAVVSRDKFLVAIPVCTIPSALSAQTQMWLLCDCDKRNSPSLKITWQKPNHHLCLLLSPSLASIPAQREAKQSAAPADMRGWVHGTEQGWGEGRGGITVNQYLPPKVKYLPIWNYSLNILSSVEGSFSQPKWHKGALVCDVFWHQAPTKV